MNMVALIGNVASEPVLTHSPSDRAICTFRLAVQRPGGTEADFFTIITWERQAELAKRYLYSGRRVGIEGRLHQTPDRETEVVAHRLQLLGPPQKSSEEE